MTKKGFGEMAITGCMAGPVFNVLMGLGLSTLGSLLNGEDSSILFSFRDKHGGLNRSAVLASMLIVAEIGALTIIALNACRNEYHIARPIALVNVIVYGCVIAALVVYTLL
jgi:Ca2+/Na+ antiporter